MAKLSISGLVTLMEYVFGGVWENWTDQNWENQTTANWEDST